MPVVIKLLTSIVNLVMSDRLKWALGIGLSGC